MLHELAVLDAEDVDELDLHRIARRWQPPELAAVRAAEGLARDDEIALGDLLLNMHRGVGERGEQHAVEELEAFRGARRRGQWTTAWDRMVHELRVEYRVSGREIMLVLTDLDKASHDLLIVFN